jgi:cell division septation protein DedD
VTAPPPPAKVVAPAKIEAVPPAKAEVKAPEKAPLTPAPKAAPASYSLQMGAMVMEENAEALKQKLTASGFPAVVRKGTAFIGRQTVTVGEPTGRREAEELARRLNVDGFPSQLMATGGKFTPQIGAFFNLDEAIDLARELQKKNYHPKITSKPANTIVYQVRHGKFDSRAMAVRRGEELKGKGFNFLVVRE